MSAVFADGLRDTITVLSDNQYAMGYELQVWHISEAFHGVSYFCCNFRICCGRSAEIGGKQSRGIWVTDVPQWGPGVEIRWGSGTKLPKAEAII